MDEVANRKIPSSMHGFKPVDVIKHVPLSQLPTTTKNIASMTTATEGLKRKREIYVDSNSLPQPLVWKRKKQFWKPFHHMQCFW